MYDPVRTAIATNTNDALPEHVWQRDTDSDAPIAHIATSLSEAAAVFTSSHEMLERSLQDLRQSCQQHLNTLISHAWLVRPHGLDTQALSLVQLLESHENHREAMLALYAVWRRHRSGSPNPRVRYLLPKPYDPTGGMLTLTASGNAAWLVTPDMTAAAAFDIPAIDVALGAILATGDGWRPTTFTPPDGRPARARPVYPLPLVDSELAACRSLLRWWALRGTAACAGRTPDQLTVAELAALSA